MKERVQQALRYPAFVLAAMGVAIVIVNLFVIRLSPNYSPA